MPNRPRESVEPVFLWGFMPSHPIQNIGDITLAGTMVSTPAWVPWLESINAGLTTATLLIGMALALARLWSWWCEWREDRRKKAKLKT